MTCKSEECSAKTVVRQLYYQSLLIPTQFMVSVYRLLYESQKSTSRNFPYFVVALFTPCFSIIRGYWTTTKSSNRQQNSKQRAFLVVSFFLLPRHCKSSFLAYLHRQIKDKYTCTYSSLSLHDILCSIISNSSNRGCNNNTVDMLSFATYLFHQYLVHVIYVQCALFRVNIHSPYLLLTSYT